MKALRNNSNPSETSKTIGLKVVGEYNKGSEFPLLLFGKNMFFTGSQAIEKDKKVHMHFNNTIRTDFKEVLL